MGICHSRVTPSAEDYQRKAQEYATFISQPVIDTISKVRYTLVTSNILTTTLINTEGTLDFALVSLYTSIVTNQNSFTENYKLCCVLLHHSSFIVSRLYLGIATQDKSFILGDNDYHTRSDTLRPLIQLALMVQEHPQLSWTSIMTDIIPDFDTLYEAFVLFRNYCHVLFNHLSYCSNTGKLPPQLLYRTEYQPYDPSLRSRSVYADECKGMDDSLTKLIALCEQVTENESTESVQTQKTRAKLRPRRVNSFVPELETVEE
jgi:hypothetical protein